MAGNDENRKRKFEEESFAERKKRVLVTGRWSDCTFIVGNELEEKVHAHRLMLAMGSPVFETMFFGSFPNEEAKPILVEDIHPKAFKAMLAYIYTEKTSFTCFYEVCQIFAAARKYMVHSLAEECKPYITKRLGIKNVCYSLSIFSLFEEKDLEEKCLCMIMGRTREVINHKSFGDVDILCLKKILSQDKLNASELDLWESVLKWSENECRRQNLEIISFNRRRVMRSLIPSFRFLTMTSSEFTEGPALSQVLNDQECLSILMNISSPTVIKMPNHICTNRIRRMHYYSHHYYSKSDSDFSD